MNDQQCVEFLQWCLPRMGYRWRGFRKVRKQVCKRIWRRMEELHLSDIVEYKEHLEHQKEEWKVLESFCYITISRFYRDHRIFDFLRGEVFPVLARNACLREEGAVRCWSMGCCAGEEAYTLQLLWKHYIETDWEERIPLKILATDRNSAVLERARRAIFPWGSIKDLPQEIIAEGFDYLEQGYRVKATFREDIEFVQQNVLDAFPSGEFDLIVCRNLVFTYFSEELQSELLMKFVRQLKSGGFLFVGNSEVLPVEIEEMEPYWNCRCIYRKV